MDRPTHRLATRALLTIALVISACGPAAEDGANDDRAGGAGIADPTVLTMAQPNDGAPPPQLASWAEEVTRLSDGSLEIELTDGWRLGETEYEAGTIEDVRNGKVDMGWVGARAFDTVGVTSFQALVAPMLIDSHDLQGAVFEAGIPEQMLEGLETIDLVGIGVLPGPMRKVLGVSKPFVQPADFENMVVGIQASDVAAESLSALGATAEPVPAGASLDGLDGYEQQLASIVGNRYASQAGYVTGNINLWPRPLVIFANADAFESLTADQQTALRDAAVAAVPTALTDSRAEDDDAVPAACSQGITLATASETDLAALRTAFEPVYAGLEADAATRAHLEAIVTLKEDVAAPPESPVCPPADATGDPSTTEFTEGTFEATVTSQDAVDRCGVDTGWDELQHYVEFVDGSVEAGIITADGTREIGFVATYTVFRDRIEFTEPGTTGTLVFRWDFDGTQLVLSDLEDDHGECFHHVVWESQPWMLVADSDEAGALIPDGRYQATLTVEDWSGVDGAIVGAFTMVFDSGKLTILQPETDEVGFEAAYTVFRDRIEVKNNVDTVSAQWTFDGEELTFSDISPSDSPFEVVWGSHPWVMVDRG